MNIQKIISGSLMTCWIVVCVIFPMRVIFGAEEEDKKPTPPVKEIMTSGKEKEKPLASQSGETGKKTVRTRAFLSGYMIVSKTKDSIIIQEGTDGQKQIHVVLDEKTLLLRRFFGKSNFDEMHGGDRVTVVGIWDNEEKTGVLATLIRDFSIEKRGGVFFGDVVSVNDSTWIIHTKRGSLTVTLSSSSNIINRRGSSIRESDVLPGHRIRVKGVWDSSSNTIGEVTEIKDFSLPVKPSGTATATTTPAPTKTP